MPIEAQHHPCHGARVGQCQSRCTWSVICTPVYSAASYRRTNRNNFHAYGYQEQGTTTTPFNMMVCNGPDRYHLVMNAVDRVPGPEHDAPRVRTAMNEKLTAHRNYIIEHGEDSSELYDWRWQASRTP